jgi:hypothetical protein
MGLRSSTPSAHCRRFFIYRQNLSFLVYSLDQIGGFMTFLVGVVAFKPLMWLGLVPFQFFVSWELFPELVRGDRYQSIRPLDVFFMSGMFGWGMLLGSMVTIIGYVYSGVLLALGLAFLVVITMPFVIKAVGFRLMDRLVKAEKGK